MTPRPRRVLSPARAGQAPKLARVLLVGASTASLLAGCSGGDGGGDTGEVTLTVAGAASLTDVLTALGRAYEAEHPGRTVRFTFGSSAALAQQVVAGAPIDVLATANEATMRTVADAGRVDGEPVVFALNELTIAVPAGNPADVADLADLGRPGVKLALCAETVPCGSAAATALDRAGVDVRPVTREEDVRAVLTKVRLREVDAGIVYRTDVRVAGDEVDSVELPAAHQVRTPYLVAAVRTDRDGTAARDFVTLLRGEQGRAALDAAGFLEP